MTAGYLSSLVEYEKLMQQAVVRAFDTVYTMWLREILRFSRSKSRIVGALATPLFFLIILGTAFGSSFTVRGGGRVDIDFLTPGILGMTILFSSLLGGVSIIWDREFGFLKEILIAPVNRFFVALGKAIGGVTTTMIQSTLMMLIAIGLGVHYSSITGLLLAVVVMFITGTGFMGLGIAIASKIESHEGFQMVMSFLTMPLVLLSGAFYPITALPGWLRTAVYVNPLTYAVEALRYLLTGASAIPPGISVTVITLFALLTIVIGGWLFGRMKV